MNTSDDANGNADSEVKDEGGIVVAVYWFLAHLHRQEYTG